MKGILIVFVLIFAGIPVYGIVINEIMYDPNQCSDDYCEWLEIFNEGQNDVNLSSWKLCGSVLLKGYINNSNGKLLKNTTFILQPNDYAIITDGGTGTRVYSNFNVDTSALAFHVSGSSMCSNGFSDGETINISNRTMTDILTYSSDWGADNNNYTLEKINPVGANIQTNWHAGFILGGTPGIQNSVYGLTDLNYGSIKITELLPDPEGDDTNNEWIELYNPTNNNINLKWAYFTDLAGHVFKITDVSAENTVIKANNYLAVHIIGFEGLLNNAGDEEISLYPSDGTLLDKVSYFGSIEGSSYAYVNGLWQTTKPTPGEENVDYSKVKDSKIEIESFMDLGSDKTAQFGQTIRARVKIYKGDSTKNMIRAFIEDGDKVSKETRTNLYSRFTDYEMTLPIQIMPNCNEKFKDGKYDVIVEGLDVSDEKSISIEGNEEDLCDKGTGTASETSKFSFDFFEYPSTIYPEKVFTTKAEIKGDDVPHNLEIWSYVYKGPTSYSGEKEQNKQKITLQPNGIEIVELKNRVIDAVPGPYKLKVKMQKDDQKTLKELTGDIVVEKPDSEAICQDTSETSFQSSAKSFNPAKPFALSTIMFESAQKKSENLTAYGVMALMSVAAILMIFFNKGIL